MPSFDEIRQSVSQSASGAMEKASSSMGLADVEEQKQPDRLDELSEMCPKLSFQQVTAWFVGAIFSATCCLLTL